MKALRSNVDMWTQIQDTGKGGYGGRLTEKLDDYIEQAGKLEELTDQLYEGLTGISFDGMYGSFIDNLMNMKYGAKEAAEDISEYFMRAMLSNKIGEMYSEKLKGWWKRFGKAMEDNDLTEAERKLWPMNTCSMWKRRWTCVTTWRQPPVMTRRSRAAPVKARKRAAIRP